MTKGIMETSPDINLNLNTDEIVQASGVSMGGQYRVKIRCTKKDNDLKTVRHAQLEDQNVYMNKLQEDLAEYHTRLVEMKTRVAEVQDDMKEEYLSRVENLENIRNLFAVKNGKLKKSSGDVWDDLKVAIEEAWSELEFY